MALPVVIPNTFAGATASIPLSQLDGNFSTLANAVNGISDGSETLANVTATTANITTVNATNLEVTNIKAKDGTAAVVLTDSTGAVTVSTELSVDNINISGNTIVSSDTDGDLNLTPNGTGDLVLDGLKWPQADGTADYVLKTDGSGQLSWTAQGGGGSLTGTTDSASPFETSLGSGAGAVNTGVNNVFVGFEAGNDNTTGTNNTAVGYQALDANTTARFNTAIGSLALGANSTGEYNTSVGYASLDANTTGTRNTAVGVSALTSNTTGSDNTAVGLSALNSNTTGSNNVAFGGDTGGYSPLWTNSTGSNNVAIGNAALSRNSTASNNVAVGHQALLLNSTGANNVAVGYQALDACTTGVANTAVGYAALTAATTGLRNVGVGYECFVNLTTGSGNVGIGDNPNDGNIFNVTTESNRGVFGHNSITNAYVKVAWTVTSDARDKTSIESVPHGLSFVQQLNPVSYRWKTNREDDTPSGNKRYGFLAQDILALEGDDPVIIDNEQPDHLKYQGEALVPVLVNAIKELSAKCDALQSEIDTLKGQ